MPSPEEQAYSAVERAYGQGEFVRALELAQALQPQLEPNRADLLDQRLQLLLGHIHLYGLAQPREAEAAYQTMLGNCQEANFRQLAAQSLRLCAQTVPATTPAAIEEAALEEREPEPPTPTEPANASTAVAAPSAAPATPWLEQLQDPQQALAQIQQTWATGVPSVIPQPAAQTAAIEAARPWTVAAQTDLESLTAEASVVEASALIPDENLGAVTESDQSEVLVDSTTIIQPESEPTTSDNPAPSEPLGQELTDAERIELERGLLLVRLSNREHLSSELGPTQQKVQELPHKGNSWTRLNKRWRGA